MSKPNDEFEATRTVVDTLKDFKQPEQQMIFRWAAEKLGLPQPFGSGTSSHLPSRTVTAPPAGPLSQVSTWDTLMLLPSRLP